jgi:hypothetical protein
LLKLTIAVEDLQNIVDIVLKYSDMSLKKRSVIGVHIADKSISLQNEIVQLKFIGVFEVLENKATVDGFSFDIKNIAKLKYPTKDATIDFINNTVYVSSGKLRVEIRSDFQHQEIKERKVKALESATLKNDALLKAIQKVKLPYSFYRGDANKAPIEIRATDKGIEVSASDCYSLCRFTTQGESTPEFKVVIPRIILSSFLNRYLEKEGTTTVEVQEMAVRIRSGSMLLVSAQLTDDVDSFKDTLAGFDNWAFGGNLDKKELTTAIKSISGSTNDKKAVTHIQLKIKASSKELDLGYTNSKSGGITYNGIKFDSLEMFEDTSQFVINVHTKSFEEFTQLLDGSFLWYGNKKAVYYQEKNSSGVVEYLFPVMSV